MHLAYEIARAVSAVAFVSYGLMCLVSGGMAEEFRRYRLERFRKLVGALEVAGGLGLAIGYFVPWVTLPASAGLALLMLLGVLTRFRVGDPFVEALPALVLMVLNAWVFYYAVA